MKVGERKWYGEVEFKEEKLTINEDVKYPNEASLALDGADQLNFSRDLECLD